MLLEFSITLSVYVRSEECRIVTGKVLSHELSLLIFVDIIKAGLQLVMNIGALPVVRQIVDRLDCFLVLGRFQEQHKGVPCDLINDRCVVQARS